MSYKENTIDIPYDMDATSAYETITGLLDTLGVEYEESGEEVITLKFLTEK